MLFLLKTITIILYVVDAKVFSRNKRIGYPFVVNVNIITPSGLMGNCVGSLVSSMFVITAAHCGSEGKTGYVTFPMADLTIEIDKIYRYERIYDQSPMKKDVAIIRLKTPISKVTPVELPSFFDEINSQVSLLSYHTDKTRSKTMRMKLKHPEQCDNFGIYTPIYFCAGEEGMATESGDSGAPVIIESAIPIQIGLVIGQQQLDQSHLSNGNLNPTVIIKISLFCDWIHNITGDVKCK